MISILTRLIIFYVPIFFNTSKLIIIYFLFFVFRYVLFIIGELLYQDLMYFYLFGKRICLLHFFLSDRAFSNAGLTILQAG